MTTSMLNINKMKSESVVFGILKIARELKKEGCSYPEIYRYLISKAKMEHDEAILIIGKV